MYSQCCLWGKRPSLLLSVVFGQSRPLVPSLLTDTDPDPTPTFACQSTHALTLSQVLGRSSSASVWVSLLLCSVSCPWHRQVKVYNAFGWRVTLRKLIGSDQEKCNSQCPILCVFVWSCWFVSAVHQKQLLLHLYFPRVAKLALRFCKKRKTQMRVVFCLVEVEIVSWSFEIKGTFQMESRTFCSFCFKFF